MTPEDLGSEQVEPLISASAIADWHFFLPADHCPEQPSSQPYRIFESRWREVILSWLGREDVEEEKKEQFIETLVNFKDSCEFYEYHAYFLAAVGIREFKTCTLAGEIIQQVVNCGFATFDRETQLWYILIPTITQAARETLAQTDISRVIESISAMVQQPDCPEDTYREALEFIEKIGKGNSQAIAALIHLLKNTKDESIGKDITLTLGKIDLGNSQAIAALIEVLQQSEDKEICGLAACSLAEIAPSNAEAIAALVGVVRETESEETRCQAARSLGKIDPGNPLVIPALIQVIKNTEEGYTRGAAAKSLVEMGQGNHEAIATSIQFIVDTETSYLHKYPPEYLGKMLVTNQQRQSVVSALQQHLNTDNENKLALFQACYQLLWNIAQHLSYADFYRAWHQV